MTRLVLQRHTGPLASMGHGLWLSDPTQHRAGERIRVFLTCPGENGHECGAVTDVDPARINAAGEVAHLVFCQEVKCGFARHVTLEGWRLPVFGEAFDTSDVTP